MGVIYRPVRCVPSHPIHSASRKYLWFLHSSPFWPSHGPTSLYNDCKEKESKGSKADGSDKGSQTSPIPGQLAYHYPGRGTSEHSDCGRPNTILRVDNQSREVQTRTHAGIFVCDLQIPPRKPTQER